MNCINSSMNSYDNNYKLHWNLILFDFRRLLLPSLRRSSANHLFSFIAKMKTKIKKKGKGIPLSTYSLPSFRKFQGQRQFSIERHWGNHEPPCASSGNRHRHQERVQRWSPSGMPAMRGHRPILFPRCSPVYILEQSTYKIHCTVHEGALSSWLLIKR